MKRSLLFLISILLFSGVIFGADEVEKLLADDGGANANAVKTMKTSEGSVVNVEGKAFIRYPNEDAWRQLIKGDKIKEKSVVITLEQSHLIVKLENESTIEISQKSRAVFESLKRNPKSDNLSDTEIKLFFGKVYSNVKRALETGARYEVKTATATAGVRGTQFAVWGEKDGTSGVIVYKGLVSFRKNGMKEMIMVKQNEKVGIDNRGKIGKKEAHSEKAPEEIIVEKEKPKAITTDEKAKESEKTELKNNEKENLKNSEEEKNKEEKKKEIKGPEKKTGDKEKEEEPVNEVPPVDPNAKPQDNNISEEPSNPPAVPTGNSTDNPPAVPTGNSTDNPPAVPAGNTTDNPPVVPAGNSTDNPPAVPTGNTTDNPPVVPAGNSTDNSPVVPAGNTTDNPPVVTPPVTTPVVIPETPKPQTPITDLNNVDNSWIKDTFKPTPVIVPPTVVTPKPTPPTVIPTTNPQNSVGSLRLEVE